MRSLLLTLLIVCALAPAAIAQEIAGQADQDRSTPEPESDTILGRMHFGLEFATMGMQHRTFETDDAGFYAGISGYGHLGNDWYLGGEYGGGTSMTFFLVDVSSFYPIELNAKRAYRLTGALAADLGAGLSYSRVHYESSGIFGSTDVEIDEWVFGGQVFGDLVLHGGPVFLALSAKYQLTTDASDIVDELEEEDGWDYTNFRIGAKVGVLIP